MSAADRAVRSLARLSRCWASASAALRVTVSASARLSPRCGTRSDTRDPRSSDSHAVSSRLGAPASWLGQHRHQDLPRHRGGAVVVGPAAVELQQEVLHQRRQALPGPALSASTSTIQPRWPRTRPPRTWNTCTEASRSSAAMPTTSASVPSPSTTACFSTARRSAPRSSRSRAAFSKSSSAAAAAISFSSRRISGSALPAMKSQKSSTISRCSSAVTWPMHGAEHLPM